MTIVTDGPNVMLKVQQLCFKHGINLAVCDVLYNKNNNLQDSSTLDDTIDESVIADYMDDSDDDNLENLDCPESGLIVMSHDLAQEDIRELTGEENINELIKKVRKVTIEK